MKKLTVKKQLVDYMIANGNDFTYTDMIKATLKIVKGQNYEYDRKYDRGFYATNFSKGSNGYLVNGGGDCGVYKNERGRWSAKYYSKGDKVHHVISKHLRVLTNEVSIARYAYDSSVSDLSRQETHAQTYYRLLNHYKKLFRDRVESRTSEAQSKIVKGILRMA
jgi:hypothetical protein